MKIVIADNENSEGVSVTHNQNSNSTAEIIYVAHASLFKNYVDADAFIDMYFDGNFYSSIHKPLLVGETITPLKELKHNYKSIGRFCNWPGFKERNCWEIATNTNNPEWIQLIVKEINKDYRLTSDEPGLVAPRILACIINEAVFALAEQVSTMAEIDMAMKFGTSYPAGPFEWGTRIGFDKIDALLKKLTSINSRYTPHPLLAHFKY